MTDATAEYDNVAELERLRLENIQLNKTVADLHQRIAEHVANASYNVTRLKNARKIEDDLRDENITLRSQLRAAIAQAGNEYDIDLVLISRSFIAQQEQTLERFKGIIQQQQQSLKRAKIEQRKLVHD